MTRMYRNEMMALKLLCTLTLLCLILLFGASTTASASPCSAGVGQYESKQFEEANATFTGCIEAADLTTEDEGIVYLYRAIARTNINQMDLASTDYLSAVSLNKELQHIYVGLGNIFAARGSFDAAVQLYDRAYRAHARDGLDIMAAEGSWSSQCKEGYITIALDLEAKAYAATSSSGNAITADLLAWGASALVLRYHDEDRLTDAGDPVIWILRLQEDDTFIWRQADWTPHFASTPARHRCTEGEIAEANAAKAANAEMSEAETPEASTEN